MGLDLSDRERERVSEHVYVCLFYIIHLSINKNFCLVSATKVTGYIYEGSPKNTVI